MTDNHASDPKAAPAAKKIQLHLVPPAAMQAAAIAHKVGADKYGEYNWRKSKIKATTYVSAALRHLGSWQDGEEFDAEGAHHLGAVLATINILLDARAAGTLIDDRPVFLKKPK